MTEKPETHAGCGFQADSQNEDLLKIFVLDEFSKISIATTSFSQKSSCFQKQVKPKLDVAFRGFRWSTIYEVLSLICPMCCGLLPASQLRKIWRQETAV